MTKIYNKILLEIYLNPAGKQNQFKGLPGLTKHDIPVVQEKTVPTENCKRK